ncbi:hypothetical protein P389DRAFT_188875 [Cystobasidium minutum MCA 4210]|uniref:uncharacterized protein n=1 Tax=Cystobasidium minutum MCA 4210 TaxID=1397322 RepID=UPI0034CF1D99|eukprot:jgi/Rhomi1/188875/estExt_fgenesh1_pg.C_3_t10293
MDTLPLDGGFQDPSPTPIPPVDKDSCALLGPTGLLVQAIMAVIVVGSLVVKRSREDPRRPWPVWLADVGKQIIGQGFLHFTNVMFSTLFSHASRGDACTAYFLSIFVDCTLGVLIIYSTLRIFSYVLIQRMHLKGFRSGQYYEKRRNASPASNGDDAIIYEADAAQARMSIDSIEDGRKQPSITSDTTSSAKPPFQFSWWGKQLMVYLGSLVVMKLAILGFFWIPAVLAIGDWMLSWLGEDTKIVFVLMIFPLAMNALQFLLIDTILKSKTPFSEGSNITQEESSSYSRRTSEDRDGHGRDEEEGRAFLLHDTTHDDLESGPRNSETLPSYRPPSKSDLPPPLLHRQDSASSQKPVDSLLEEDKDVWADMAAEEDEDFSATPRPISRLSQTRSATSASSGVQKSSAGAIPLRPVSSHKRRDSELSTHSDGNSETGKEGEGTGWDWLSDDGSAANAQDGMEDAPFPEQGSTSAVSKQAAPLKSAKVE